MASDSESSGDERVAIPRLAPAGQLFLQAAMSRRFYSNQTGQMMYKRACAIVGGARACMSDATPYPTLLAVTPGSFADFQLTISTALEPYGLALKSGIDHRDGRTWHVLINTVADDVSQVATEFTPLELTFYRQLVRLASYG
jgi:hypothetical protein